MANRLASETSPYLLQHAGNPVDWHPWDDEALALAARQDRPILLSIGYSACHWCHVMERESFEDPETAGVMNRLFVNIKVDREERPDIDSIYMGAVQAMTGHGGWPLTAFLTPGGAPFHAGTYYPPEPRHGMPSFRQVLAAAADAYSTRRGDVERAGARIAEALRLNAVREHPASGQLEAPGPALFAHAVNAAGRGFDPVHGGFGGAPKFPQPVFLDFLLRTGGPSSRGGSMAVHTLTRMAAGGIRDHAGGGFHRYSVDARWLVPHFEKMLYDNALIARAMARAHVLGARHLGAVAQETLDYVVEDLSSPEGAFFSARDADSEGEGGAEEGAFYLWTPGEVRSLLGPDEARLLCRVFDVSEAGNFEGRNILHLPHDLDAVARQEGMARGELDAVLRRSLAVLKESRAARPEPLRDDKVIASWNGMAIRALAEAGPALGRPDHVRAAERAAGFVLSAMRTDAGVLHRIFCRGSARIPGFLEDHAAMGLACIALYEATLDARWLCEADWLAERTIALFWSPAERLFHDAAAGSEPLLVRPRDIMDNATPSGNSLAAEFLARSAALTGSEAQGEIADAVVARELGAMERHPMAVGRLLTAALLRSTPALECALVGAREEIEPLIGRVHLAPHPNRVIVGGDPSDPAIAALPAMEGRAGHAGTADHAGRADRPGTAFVCIGSACQEPARTPEELDAALAKAQPVSIGA